MMMKIRFVFAMFVHFGLTINDIVVLIPNAPYIIIRVYQTIYRVLIYGILYEMPKYIADKIYYQIYNFKSKGVWVKCQRYRFDRKCVRREQ